MLGNYVLLVQGLIFYLAGALKCQGDSEDERFARTVLTILGGIDTLIAVICIVKGGLK